jgi:hypothetical protein
VLTTIKKFKLTNIINLVFFFVALNNLVYIFFSTQFNKFYEDEYQHTFISWRTYLGELLYKDFFEHHGFLYPFFNQILFNLTKAEPGIDLLFMLRIQNYFILVLIFALIFMVTKKITRSYSASFFAIAAFSYFETVQEFSSQIRPDLLQTFLMLLAFYFLIVFYNKKNKSYLLISGVLFALMQFCNFKVVIVIACLALFFISEYFIFKTQGTLKSAFFLSLGFITTIIIGLSFFGFQGCLEELIYYNTKFNGYFGKYNFWLINSAKEQSIKFFFDKNLSITIFSLIALATTHLKLKRYRLLAFLCTFSLYGSLIGLYPYYAFIYIPFYCVLTGKLYYRIILMSKNKKYWLLGFSFLVLILFYFGPRSKYFKIREEFEEHHNLKDQRRKLDWVLENIPRSEKVAILKVGCIGYIFNELDEYFWISNLAESKAAKKDLNKDFIEKLETEKTKYIFSKDFELRKPNREEVKEYIESKYEKLSIGKNDWHNCIRRRRDEI